MTGPTAVIGGAKVDPIEVVGIRSDVPVPYWGWGTIPDQYGRRWADDGQSPPVGRPSRPHPMLLHAWPAQDQVPALDMSELRAAISAADAARFLAAVLGHDVDDVLQQVGAGIPMALKQRRKQAESVAVSVINRLTWRAGPGDEVLAEDLLACLRGESLAGRVVPGLLRCQPSVSAVPRCPRHVAAGLPGPRSRAFRGARSDRLTGVVEGVPLGFPMVGGPECTRHASPALPLTRARSGFPGSVIARYRSSKRKATTTSSPASPVRVLRRFRWTNVFASCRPTVGIAGRARPDANARLRVRPVVK